MPLSTVMYLDSAGEDRVVSLEWIVADLPPGSSLALSFEDLETKRPLGQSFTGLARVEIAGAFAWLFYYVALVWDRLLRLVGLRRQLAAPRPPATRYIVVRGATVTLDGVVLARGTKARVRMRLAWPSAASGAVHSFQVVERDGVTALGGSTFRVRGPLPQPAATRDPTEEEEFAEGEERARENEEDHMPAMVIAWNRPNER